MLAVRRIVDGVAGLEPKQPIPHRDFDQAGDHVDSLFARVSGVRDVLELARLKVDEVRIDAPAGLRGSSTDREPHRFLGGYPLAFAVRPPSR